jgi:hypothetical protein
MSLMRPVVYAIMVLIGALAVLDFACERLENPRAHFDTYAEMESAGWIERGWIPTYLPRSATDIDETHDIDTNEVSVVFRFDPGDTQTTRTVCRLSAQTPEGLEFLCPPFEHERNVMKLGSDGTGRFSSSQNEP